MSSTKSRVIYGLLAKAETTYLTYSTPTVGTNGVMVAEYPELAVSFGETGLRGPAPGNAGVLIPTAPAAPIYEFTAKMESRGGGAAYSASVYPNEHVFLQMAGFTAAVTTTGGSERWTYTPTPGSTANVSGSLIAYTDQEIHLMKGGYCSNATYEIENGKPAMWTFDVKAAQNGAPTDDAGGATAKTITYSSVVPFIVSPLVMTINSVSTLVLDRFTFAMNRDVGPRAKGAYGFHPGRRAPTISFTVEKEAKATIDFEALRAAGTAFAVSATFGSTQYNRDVWSFPQAKISDLKAVADGERALYEVTCALYSSTPILNDEIDYRKT